MKPVFAKKAARPDPELLTLKAELLEAQGDLAQAYRQFDQALDPELVESCVYQISAVKARCNYLIRAIKERSPEAAAAAGPGGRTADGGPHRHRPGAEPVECPSDRRSGPAGICAAAVGPVGFVALHNCFQTPGPFFTSGIKIPVLQVPAHIPACKPPDGQGRRGGDGDGFVQACVHPQPDLRQFFRFIPDDVTGFPVAGIALMGWVYTPRTGYGPYIHTGCPYAS